MTHLVRVAFRFGDPRLFSRLVVGLRGGDSAHCEVAHAWQGELHQCVSASWVDDGVRAKAIEMPASKWRLYELQAAVHPLDYLEEHDEDGYDLLGLAGVMLPRLGHSKRRRFCVEACGEMVGLAEPQLFDLRQFESVCGLIGRRVTYPEVAL